MANSLRQPIWRTINNWINRLKNMTRDRFKGDKCLRKPSWPIIPTWQNKMGKLEQWSILYKLVNLVTIRERNAKPELTKNAQKKKLEKEKNSKLFNGFKLGMLYNTTVTAYEHKSFLFWVKKNNVRRNQRGYETRTSRTLTGGHPPSTPSQWNEIIR